MRLHPNNINRDCAEIEFPEAWMPTIKKHSSRSIRTSIRNNNKDLNVPIATNQGVT